MKRYISYFLKEGIVQLSVKFSLALFVLTLAACGETDDLTGNTDNGTALSETASSTTSGIASKGIFQANAEEAEHFLDLVSDSSVVGRKIAADLTRKFKLPTRDVFITYKACNTPLSFYDKNKSEIVMCYEMLDKIMAEKNDNVSQSQSIFKFLLMHLMAHAFIDQMNLPFKNFEEELVDSITIALLIGEASSQTEKQEGAKAAIFGAEYLNTLNNRWTSNHHIIEQRLNDIICLAAAGEASVRNDSDAASIHDDVALRDRQCASDDNGSIDATNSLLQNYRK